VRRIPISDAHLSASDSVSGEGMIRAARDWTGVSSERTWEGTIRKVTYSLLGAAALAAGLLLIRQQKQEDPRVAGELAPGEAVPSEISLERLRELGI
jgi:hypothetical protein